MKEIVKHFDKKSWLYVLLNAGVILLQVFAELKMPDYMAEITQLVQTQGNQLSGILRCVVQFQHPAAANGRQDALIAAAQAFLHRHMIPSLLLL